MSTNDQNAVDLFSLVGDSEIFQKKVYAEEQVLYFLKKAQELLEQANITQAELARGIGAKRSQVNRWLTNETGLNAKSMFLIAKGLGYELKLQWCPVKAYAPVTPEEGSTVCSADGASTSFPGNRNAPVVSFFAN